MRPLGPIAIPALLAMAPLAAGALTALPVAAQAVTIVPNADYVTYVNLLAPADGVSVEDLADQLLLGMRNDAGAMPGFRSASIHVARDGAYVLNYAQWDDTASVDAVVAALGEGRLPDLAQAFAMASPEFHPYDVVSITLAGE
jgi:hypothetical protein